MTQRDLENVLAGPGRLSLGGLDLGHTAGPVRLTVTPTLRPVRSDAWGRAPVDYVHAGTEIRLSARLAEWTPWTLEALLPLGTSSGGGLALGASGGGRLRVAAAELRLHPLERADADTTHDLVFWQAVATGATAVAFGREEDRVFEAEFLVLPDPARTDGERLGTIGAA